MMKARTLVHTLAVAALASLGATACSDDPSSNDDAGGADVAADVATDAGDTGDDAGDSGDSGDDADDAGEDVAADTSDATDAADADEDVLDAGDADAADGSADADADLDATDATDATDASDAEDASDVDLDVADADDADTDVIGPPPEPGVMWSVDLVHGSFGSPRALPDRDEPTFLLAYGNEFLREGNTPDQRGGSLSLFDAQTGDRLTRFQRDEELFTVPIPIEDDDGVTTWIVGGRNATLARVDIRDDSALWAFSPSGDDARDEELYNFFQPRLVDDLNDDGVPEVLIPNGGDHLAPPFSTRDPGFLLVLDGADGSRLHQMQMPDDQETYLGLTFWDRPDGTWVVFGTGGETQLGHLWAAPLDEIVAGDIDGAVRVLDGYEDRGYIGPPAYALIDDDEWYDLVVYSFGGRLAVLSGATGEAIWTFDPSLGRESPATPAIGDFDGDGDLDIAVGALDGVFPAWTMVNYRVYDALDGTHWYESEDRWGRFAAAAPIAGDIDGDGIDEVIFAEVVADGASEADIQTDFYALHADEERLELLLSLGGFAGGAGWLGDIDLDGYPELIVSTNDIGYGRMARYNFDVPMPEGGIRWGAYFGSNYDGRY